MDIQNPTILKIANLTSNGVITTSGGNGTLGVKAEGVGGGLNADTVDGSHASAFAASSHTHVESDVTNLVSDLAAKVPTTRTISVTAPITGGGDLSTNRTIGFDTSYIREKLTASRTYYVRTDGNDSNTGLVNSSGGAFLTIQKAVNTIADLDTGSYDVTVQIADGTYTGQVIVGAFMGTGQYTIQGNASTPTNVVISVTSNDAIQVNGFLAKNPLIIKDLQVGTTTSGVSIHVRYSSIVTLQAIDFAACAGVQLRVGYYAQVSLGTNYTISGGGTAHQNSYVYGFIGSSSRTCTISNTPAFSTAFTVVTLGGIVQNLSATYSGSATGQRYNGATNGIINTNGGGANYYPGNSAGAVATQAQYL